MHMITYSGTQALSMNHLSIWSFIVVKHILSYLKLENKASEFLTAKC